MSFWNTDMQEWRDNVGEDVYEVTWYTMPKNHAEIDADDLINHLVTNVRYYYSLTSARRAARMVVSDFHNVAAVQQKRHEQLDGHVYSLASVGDSEEVECKYRAAIA